MRTLTLRSFRSRYVALGLVHIDACHVLQVFLKEDLLVAICVDLISI